MSKLVIVGGTGNKASSVISKLHSLFVKTAMFERTEMYNGEEAPKDVSDADMLLWFPDINNEQPKDYPIKGRGSVLICSKVMREAPETGVCGSCRHFEDMIEGCMSYGKDCHEENEFKHYASRKTTRIDAVTRIFKMHGNAVIAIRRVYAGGCTDCAKAKQVDDGTPDWYKYCGKKEGTECDVHNLFAEYEPDADCIKYSRPHFEFELIDALNNTWCKTTDLQEFVDMAIKLYTWTKTSVRKSLTPALSKSMWHPGLPQSLDEFMAINRELALKVAAGCGNRFFGNFSTRCTKLFPSNKLSPTAFAFSPRNVDKRSVTSKDLVITTFDEYYGDRKPSVDTPVQLELYRKFPKINFMIHGHAYIVNAQHSTQYYFPCGDLREVDELITVLKMVPGLTRINLKAHGFLLVGETIEEFHAHLAECEFVMI